MRVRRIFILAGIIVAIAAGAAIVAPAALEEWRSYSAASDDDIPRAPAGNRIKVEVLNAAGTRGLAMRATRHLRDLGYDVVGVGNAPASSTPLLVLDRSGNESFARAVAASLGGAPVEARPDSSRHLDVTVVVGAGWAPPRGPFDP
jgi:hypothetical protein